MEATTTLMIRALLRRAARRILDRSNSLLARYKGVQAVPYKPLLKDSRHDVLENRQSALRETKEYGMIIRIKFVKSIEHHVSLSISLIFIILLM